MTIDKIKVQPTPPKSNCLMWAQPNGDIVDLKINVRGKWTPVGGSSSSSDDSSSEKIIFNPNDFSSENRNAIDDAFFKKMNITDEDIQNMTEEELDNLDQQFSDFVSTILTTQDHGDIVLSSPGLTVFLCEDGTIFKKDENALEYESYFEMPSYMRYQLGLGDSSDILVAYDIVTGQKIPNSKLHVVTDKVYVSNIRTDSDRDLIFHIDSAKLPEQESNSNESIWVAIDTDIQYFQDNVTTTPSYYAMYATYGPAEVENIRINKMVLQKGEVPVMPS